jgi:hypothetical protein
MGAQSRCLDTSRVPAGNGLGGLSRRLGLKQKEPKEQTGLADGPLPPDGSFLLLSGSQCQTMWLPVPRPCLSCVITRHTILEGRL